MDVYKTKVFTKWAKGERLTDQDLCRAVSEIEEGYNETQLAKALRDGVLSKVKCDEQD